MVAFASAAAVLAQPNPYPATTAAERLAAYQQRRALQQQSRLNALPIRNIGPTVMSGRVVDVDVNPAKPHEFYVAYASGGLWYTANNGISFRPIFDTTATLTLGDIAVNWQTGALWVGTGEVNSSRSSYAGIGVYTSADTGRTWQYRGLPESHHIGRIVLHPTEPGTAWVAVLGHLYSENRERGIYKTTNGGASWAQTLFVDDTTGAIDVALHPTNPNVLWAATWTRSRRAWNFREAGPGSAIYRSDDSGATWSRQTNPGGGFPTGHHTGRIGLAVYDGSLLYAVVDNQAPRPTSGSATEPLITAKKLKSMTKEAFLALPPDSLNRWLDDNGIPKQHTAKTLAADVQAGKYTPADLARYVDRGDDGFTNTPLGGEVYRSADGGKTWARTHDAPIEMYSTYGYYFGQVHVDPQDPNRLYTYGVPIYTSADGGKTWQGINADNVHADHHALWVNPRIPGHIVLGNDGGVNISYDYGAHWLKCNTPPVGQFYAIQVDAAEPYNVYGGLQDNGTWKGPSTYTASPEWYDGGRYPYSFITGGDGMQVMVDPRDGTTYTGFQFGNYTRTDPSGKRTRVTPNHKLGEPPLRFNWQTPIWLSKHNPDILYFGANRVYRSLTKGDTWEAISPDLTTQPAPGDVPYGTLSCLTESPHAFGVLYAGSDDGKVRVTRDGGVSWKDISAGLPQDLWVSRLEVSPHDPATVFVALNGYRWDHFTAYLYRSTDYGATWQRLGTDLPAEPINVVRQDPANANLLYVGTDHGLYLSLDGGSRFEGYLNPGFPEVPVHDLLIHPKAKEAVLGTHGRSLFVVDVEHLQQLTPNLLAENLSVFAPEAVTASQRWGAGPSVWDNSGEPTTTVTFYCKAGGKVSVQLGGKPVTEVTHTATPGLNRIELPLALGAYLERPANPKTKTEAIAVKAGANGKKYLTPGKHTFTLTVGEASQSFTLEVKAPRERTYRSEPQPTPEE